MFFCSCKKEEDFPVTLYANKITHITPVRLYVGQTQITDSKIIDKFISNASCFELPDDNSVAEATIHFYSKDSASFDIDPRGYSVQKDGNYILFYSSFIPTGGLDIKYPLFKYISKYYQLSPNTGFSYMTKEVYVGYGSYTNLEICVLAYKISRNAGRSYSRAWGTTSNVFNEEAINTLQYSDTLAIREHRVRFVSK